MENRKVTLNELISNMVTEATRLGFSGSYIWRELTIGCGAVRKYYQANGVIHFTPDMTLRALADAENKYRNGDFSRGRVIQVRGSVRRMNEFYLTGTLQANNNRVHSGYILNGENERLVDEFVSCQGYGENTVKDAIWVARKYLYFFEQAGHSSLATVTVEDVRDFILDTAAKVRTSTLHDIYLYLHAFHLFLKEHGIQAPDCADLFSYTIHRECRFRAVLTMMNLKKS